MTDHEKLMVSLTASKDARPERVTAGDVVTRLYELGRQYREDARDHAALRAAS